MSISRRDFLGCLALLAAAGSPGVAEAIGGDSHARGRRLFLTVRLSGGNDAFNTVVPYKSSAYYAARPRLALAADSLLPLDGEVAFHPALKELHCLFKQGCLAVIPGVGYPGAQRSHTRSAQIWETAEPDRLGPTSWIRRCLEEAELSSSLAFAAKSVTMGGFDTHDRQSTLHGQLLQRLSSRLGAFYESLVRQDRHRDVLVLVFSEFGRRLLENMEGGTDHAHQGSVLVLGGAVRGGVFGAYSHLSSRSDTAYETDFRRIYATIASRWLSVDSRRIFDARYEELSFL